MKFATTAPLICDRLLEKGTTLGDSFVCSGQKCKDLRVVGNFTGDEKRGLVVIETKKQA